MKSPTHQTTQAAENHCLKNDNINQRSAWNQRHPFLSRSLLDCTVGTRFAKLKVSTRKSTKHVFASPVSADIGSALGHVFRWCVSGAPVWIPRWLKCAGRTTWKCLATDSHKSRGIVGWILIDGTRPNQGRRPKLDNTCCYTCCSIGSHKRTVRFCVV